MDYYKKALELHEKYKGKIDIKCDMPLNNREDLAVAYTPGVAQPCLEIAKDPENAYKYTSKGHLVAIVTDGSAVLGLGNIGGMAGMPVMEGKAARGRLSHMPFDAKYRRNHRRGARHSAHLRRNQP